MTLTVERKRGQASVTTGKGTRLPTIGETWRLRGVHTNLVYRRTAMEKTGGYPHLIFTGKVTKQSQIVEFGVVNTAPRRCTIERAQRREKQQRRETREIVGETGLRGSVIKKTRSWKGWEE